MMVHDKVRIAAIFSKELGRSQTLKTGALVILWSLYPVVFALSHNWFTITGEQIWFLLFLVPMVAIAAYGLCSVVFILMKSLWLGFGNSRSDKGDPLAGGGVCAIVATIYALLHTPLLTILDKEIWLLVILVLFGGIVYFFLAANKFMPVFLLGFSLVLMVAAEWVYNYAAEGGAIAKASAIARDTGLDVSGKGLVFPDTPNIYLIIYDGYGNKAALKTIYDVDNSDISEFLRAKGFVVNDNSFSNYRITWPMLLALFLANHHYYEIAIGSDDTSVGRLILNGTAFNPVYSVLNDNGYKLQSIHRGHYFGGKQGKIDYYFPPSNIWNGFDIFDSSYLDFLHVRLGHKTKLWVRQRATLDERIAFAAKDEFPWFTLTYIYKPNHAKRGKKWTELDDFEDSYRRELEDANRHMRHVVERIQSQDPNAFILLMGDHGGWRFGRSWHNKHTNDPNEAFEINGVPVETVTLDVFGILMAIETGGRCDEYIYDALSPVNVMRVIFSCLSGKDLLANKPRDDSYFGGRFGRKNSTFLTVESGAVLERWLPLTERIKTHGAEALP
jgi:hypothetical protein